MNRGYVYVISMVAALGGLLFGYDTAVVSGAIGFMEQRFDLSEFAKGLAASSALVGCIFGAAMAGLLSDRFGRRPILQLAAALFLISAIGSAVPRNLLEFNIARFVGGLGVGMASMLSPLYIAEAAPPAIRGRLVSLNQFAIILGMLVVYVVNSRIALLNDEAWNIAMGWRWMFGSEAIPAIIFGLLLLAVPESPRFLVKRNREPEARAVLNRLVGPGEADREIDEIREAIALEQSGSIVQLLRPGLRIALIIGVVLAVLQQVTGINVILYYAPEILKTTGIAATDAISATVIVGLVNLTFTIVSIYIVDRVGRKPLLLCASAGMGITLATLGYVFLARDFEGPFVFLLILGYVASFAIAMGPVVWVVLSEIFPTRIRGRAMSIATVCLWIACFIVSLTFPWMLGNLAGGSFFIYSFMCVVAFLFVAFLVPETKGKTLEQIERDWLFNVKLSGETAPSESQTTSAPPRSS